MTFGAWEIVGQNDRELPLGTTIGDALRRLVRRRWPNNSAKKLEGRWGLDPKTARNVVGQSNVSERTLTKAALAEGWELWHALGQELFGESYCQYEQRRIDAAIQEAEDARSNIVRLVERGEELLARAATVEQASLREVALQTRGGESRTWSEADGFGAQGTRGARDRGGR